MWTGTKLSLLQKSGKGGLGWQTSKPPSQVRHPQNLNYQKPQSTQKSTQETQPGKYPSQAKWQWEAEMERLNCKNILDCFSDSELDSESDEGEQYQYEQRYETLILTEAENSICQEFVILSL